MVLAEPDPGGPENIAGNPTHSLIPHPRLVELQCLLGSGALIPKWFLTAVKAAHRTCVFSAQPGSHFSPLGPQLHLTLQLPHLPHPNLCLCLRKLRPRPKRTAPRGLSTDMTPPTRTAHPALNSAQAPHSIPLDEPNPLKCSSRASSRKPAV